MNKENIDDLLFMAGEKMEMDSLGEPCAYHHFSEDYEKRKKLLREQVRSQNTVRQTQSTSGRKTGVPKKKFSVRRWSVFAAAAVLVCAMSLMVYAYFKNLEMDVSQNKNKVFIEIKEKVDSSSESSSATDADNVQPTATNEIQSRLEDLPADGIEVPAVRITLNYIPDGYAEIEGLTGRYSMNGEYAGDGFWAMQNTHRSTDVNFTKEYEALKIGDMDAIVTIPEETDTESTYYAYIYLLNPADMVSIMIGTDYPEITVDELKKIAEGLVYEPTGEMCVAYAEPENFSDEPTEDDLRISKTQLTQQFEIVDSQNNTARVEVKNIEFTDSINGLDRNDFYDRAALDNYLTSDGSFKDERIPQVYDGEGMSAVKEAADQKLMLITLELTNTCDTDIIQYSFSGYFDADLFEDYGDFIEYSQRPYYYDELGSGEWCYLDSSDYTSNEEERTHSFFCIDIPAGKSRTVTIGKVVYDDEIDRLYLNYVPYGSVPYKAEYNKDRQLMRIQDFLDGAGAEK